MPFSLTATTHIFTKTAQGGVQQVVVKKSDDAEQVRLTRLHLQEIREQFLKGDFSGPTRIHGHDMPGLSELKAAAPGQVAIAYKDIKGGAELSYTTANAAFVAALHRWFDAQLSDHGKDAMAGHAGHAGHSGHAGHGEMKKPVAISNPHHFRSRSRFQHDTHDHPQASAPNRHGGRSEQDGSRFPVSGAAGGADGE